MSMLQPTLEAFVTHIESVGPLLKLWAQLDRKQATFVERLILQVTDRFERELNAPKRIEIGHVCCARYSDGVYYRARITGVSELALGKVAVHFIDFGNSETVLVSDIRSLDEVALAPLIQVNEQATELFLAGVIPLAGSWDDSSMAFVKQMICYEDLKCMIVGQVGDKRIVKVFYHNEDLATILIGKKICVGMSLHAQQVLIQGYFSLSSVPPQFPGFNIPPPTRLLLTPPPAQPQQLAMPILPPVSMITAPQPMVVQPVIQPPVRETVKVFTSPKLEINSEHMVYVSCVEDGPLAFVIQLQATEDMLSSLMSEINTPPAIPLTQPLMPGSVCLGRFTEDHSLCRAVVSAVLDDKYKLYYVDFGISEILPYSEIYELPQQFINVKVMAIRFALSGLKNLHITEELKAYFKDLVTQKLLCLRVVAPEGPPLKHYGELYLNGTSVFKLLLQRMKEIQQSSPPDYQLVPALPVGTRDFVKISYVVNLSHFFVQLLKHTEALNSIMLAVDTTCDGSARHVDESQLKIGLPCCALYGEDGKWYRARIMSFSSNLIEVMYVDYGNTDKVPLSSLKCIDPSLVDILKPQAIPCCLNEYENNVDDELAVNFEEITLDKMLTMVVVASLENGKLLVEILDNTTGMHINVGRDEMVQETVIQPAAEIQTSYSSPVETDGWKESDNKTQEPEMSFRGKPYEKKTWGSDRERNQRGSRFQTSYREAPPNLMGLSWRYSQGKSRFDDDRARNDSRDGNRPWQKKDTGNWRQEDGEKSNRGKWGNGDGAKGGGGRWGSRGGDDRQGKFWQDSEDGGAGFGQKKFRSRDENEAGRGGGRWNSDESGGRRKRWSDNEENGGFKKKWNDGDIGGRRNRWNNNNDDDGGGRQKKWDDNEEGGGGRRNKWRDDNENFQKGKRFDDNSYKRKNYKNENDFGSRGHKSWGENENTGQNFRFQKTINSKETSDETWVPNSVPESNDQWNDMDSLVTTSVTKIPEACVKVGNIKTGNVVFIGSPEEFCTQVASDSNKLMEIMDGLAVTYGSGGGNPIPQTDLKSGRPCVARYSEDNTIYRAVVQSVGENMASVFFCDYGNNEEVSFNDIKEISSEFVKYPVQGIMCKLLAAKPQHITWTDDEINEFISVTEGKELQIQFVNKNNGIYEIVLEDTESGVNINEKFGAGAEEIKAALMTMTSSKYSQGLSSVDVDSFTIATPDQRFSIQTLSPEFSDEVTITWFINSEKFYCQSLSSKSDLSDMMNIIQSAYCHRSPIKSTVEVGSPVIAKFKSDGVLYRAEVKSVSDPSTYIVQFVDYGNHDLVDKFNLWYIESRFMNLPKQAHLCSLCGVKPSDLEWTRQDEIDKYFEADKFNCTFHNSENGVNFVTLLTSEGKSVADELVANGFAVRSEIPQAVSNDAESVDTSLLHLVTDAEPVDTSLLPGQIMFAYITYIEGISKFYIQLNKMIADKIQALIAEHVQKPENMIPIGPECLSVNSLCIATPDGEQWYRGKIIDCATTTGVFVKFIDFGDGDEIPLDKVLNIPLELAQYAEQAMECCVSHSEETILSPELQEQFKTEFETTDVIISIDSVANQRLFVTIFNEEGKKPELLKDMGIALTEIQPVLPMPIVSKKSVVWVSHADELNSLWLQRVNDAEIIVELLERLYSFYEIEQKGVKLEISVGKFCAAKSANDEQWYRGKVTSLNANEETCSILFVDYGNSEILPVSQVMVLDASVSTLNAQAINVSLPVKCDESTDVTKQLLEMVAEKEFVAHFAHKKEEKWIVDLFDKGLSLSKKIFASGLVKYIDDYPFSPSESSDLASFSVFISHVGPQCEIWAQKASDHDAVMNLQNELQNTIDSVETMTSVPSVGTKCMAIFSETWYRAVVIEKSNSSVTVQFIDYGNMDDIDIASEGLKALPTRLQEIPAYAEKCVLGKASEWTFKPKAYERLEKLVLGVEKPLTLKVLSRGDVKHVDIEFSDGSSILNLLTTEGLVEEFSSTDKEYIRTENVFVSHVNSPSSFWLQYENKTSEIEELKSRMLKTEDFSNVEQAEEGDLHAAMFSDGQLYRAKILRKTDEGYEVLFIDYGNSSVVTELRSLPEDLLNLCPFAKHCSLPLSVNLQWSEKAKNKFIAGDGTLFTVRVLTDGDPAVVSLFDGNHIVEDELTKLNPNVNDGVDKISSSLELGTNSNQFKPESVIFISHVNTPSSFWIQYENRTSEIEEMESRMLEAENFTDVEQVEEGVVFAAMLSYGEWYRAKILRKTDEDYEVLFIDYGNSSVIKELKSLPEDLLNVPPLAKHCCLPLLDNMQWSEEAKHKLIEKAAGGTTSFNITVLTDDDPAVVSLYDGNHIVEEELRKFIKTVNAAVVTSCKSNACVCHVNSLSDFWIQFEDSVTLLEDISKQLDDSDSFLIPEKFDINTLCVAQFPDDGNWYRARILSRRKEGAEVMYVDFGNTSIATEFRELPENLVDIPPVAKNCALSLPGDLMEWPESTQNLFVEIVGDVSKLFEVEIICDTVPAVINLYDAGERIQNIILNTDTESKTDFNEKESAEDGDGIGSDEIGSYMDPLENPIEQNETKFQDAAAEEIEEFEEAIENGDMEQAEEQLEIEKCTEVSSVVNNNCKEAEMAQDDSSVLQDSEMKDSSGGESVLSHDMESCKSELSEVDAANIENDMNNGVALFAKSVAKEIVEMDIQKTEHVEKQVRDVEMDIQKTEHVEKQVRDVEMNIQKTEHLEKQVRDVEMNIQKTEHTEKLIRELSIQIKTPEKRAAEKTPSVPKSFPQGLNSTSGMSKEDSHKSNHDEKVMSGSKSKSVCIGSEKDKISQSAPSTPSFSRSEKISKSISSYGLSENSSSRPSSPRLSHNERIVPGCISRGESLELVRILSSPKLPHSERLVPGCIVRGSSEKERIQEID